MTDLRRRATGEARRRVELDGERVHPHPGMPKRSMMTQNVRGVGGLTGLTEFMRVFQSRKRKEAIGVACVQEHNLSPDLEGPAQEKAKVMGCAC